MPWSNVSLVMNSRDRTAGVYNASQFNAVNQNLVQGQIHSLSLTEINFPYDIPNVQEGFNSFSIDYVVEPGGIYLQPTVPVGFYTGAELAAAVTAAIIAAGAANEDPDGVSNPIAAIHLPTCEYDAVSNRFTLQPPAEYAVEFPYMQIDSTWTFPAAEAPSNRVKEGELGKDLLSIMGFVRNISNQYDEGVLLRNAPGNDPDYPSFSEANDGVDGWNVPAVGGSAPLAFTQYVDICSPQLCKFQELAGGSTTNLARRGDLICRLYVANNIATAPDAGLRPFVIGRQYQNARIMKWTAGNSIGQMDIQLYDDTGAPLLTSWEPRPYQITFAVYEGGDEMEQVTDSATGEQMTLRKFAPYQPQNAQAWSSGTFPMRSRR